jgi:hypothetical protein
MITEVHRPKKPVAFFFFSAPKPEAFVPTFQSFDVNGVPSSGYA